MEKQRPPRMDHLSGSGPCSVVRCPCGCFHVNVGPATLRLSSETLQELARVLAEASGRADGPSDVAVH